MKNEREMFDKIDKMRMARHLLPPPRGEVVGELIEVIDYLRERHDEANKKEKAADTYRTIASIHKNFRHETIAAGFMKKAARLTS